MTKNCPELDALLLDGMENLQSLSDERLREYAVWSLRYEGATASNTMSQLAAMASVSAARVRQQHADSLAGEETPGLVDMFVEIAESLERELRTRARPN
jgi:hypothetical protein